MNKFLGFLFSLVAFLALTSMGSAALHAADLPSTNANVLATAPAIVQDVLGDGSWLVAFLVGAAEKYTWLVTVLLCIAALRVVFKPAFSVWHFIVARTGSQTGAAFLAKVEGSPALKWFVWALDLTTSIKLVPITPAQQKIAKAIELEQKAVSYIPAV